MENTRKLNTKTIVRGSALALTGLLCAGVLPVGISTLTSKAAEELGRKSISLLNTEDSAVKGGVYDIRQAYFGGKIPFGLTSASYNYDDVEALLSDVTDISSEITVTYGNGREVDVTTTNTATDFSPSETDRKSAVYGTFPVQYAGTYTINYSMTIDGQTYSMDLKVKSESQTASFSFPDYASDVLPTIYDLNYSKVKTGSEFKDVVLPKPTIYDANGDEIAVSDYFKTKAEAGTSTDYVLVSVTKANSGNLVSAITDGKVTILGEDLNTTGAGTYTVLYTYYSVAPGATSSQFVTSATRTFEVKNEQDADSQAIAYYDEYELKIKENSTPTFVTGVESVLPTISSTAKFNNSTGTSTTESVNVKYSVKAYRSTTVGTYTEDVSATDIYTNADGKIAFKPSQDGRYKIEYTATDFYGNTATTSIVTSSEVKDTQKPVAYVYDASDVENDPTTGTYIDASSKLKTKAFSENVVIYAIGATDNVSSLDNIELQRRLYYTNSNQITIKEYSAYNLIFGYKFESLLAQNPLISAGLIADSVDTTNEADVLAWLKTNKYLIVKTNRDFADLSTALGTTGQINGLDVTVADNKADIRAYLATQETALTAEGVAYVDTDYSLSTGTYDIYYEATDESDNKSEAKTYSMNITNNSSIDSSAPVINFATVLEETYTTKDVVTFAEPTASDDVDTRMDLEVFYQYYTGSGWDTTKHFFEDDKYSIDLSTAPANATKVRISAVVADDFGNSSTYTKEFAIANINDVDVPSFVDEVEGTAFGAAINQGEEVVLPTITYRDSYADVMNYNVKVFAIDNGTRKEISVYGDSSDWSVSGLKKNFVLNAGKFVAAYAGDYEVAVVITDPAGNYISNYYGYSVVTSVEDYFKVVAAGSINGTGSAVVGSDVKFSIPTLAYTLGDPNQSLYGLADTTTKSLKNFSIQKISGGNLTKKSNTTYVMDEVGTYKFRYKAQVAVYDNTVLSQDSNGVYAEISGVKYYAYMEGTQVILEDVGGNRADATTFQDKYEEKELFSDVKTLSVTAATVTKTFSVDGVYANSSELNNYVTILDVDGLDENVDMDKSTVTVSYASDAANGTTATIKLADLVFGNNSAYPIVASDANSANSVIYRTGSGLQVRLSRNARYTITYKIQDTAGTAYTATTSSFIIDAGDVTAPTIRAKDGFVKDTYKKGDVLSLDINKLTLSDDVTPVETLKSNVTYVLKNTSTGETIDYVDDDNKNQFRLEEVGTYTLTVTVKDGAGVTTTMDSISFEVTSKGKTTTFTYETIGTILIVVASVILAAVILYFVISKLKTDKQLKGKKAKRK